MKIQTNGITIQEYKEMRSVQTIILGKVGEPFF